MRPAAMLHSERITAGALISLLLAGMIPVMPLDGQQSGSPAALDRAKSIAETQHEIVLLLIKKKEFEKAATEANKIFEMKWPEDQESLLLRELLFLTGQFLSQGKADLGLQLIDRNSKSFKKTSSRVAILKERGYLYKNMGQDDKAIDCFKKARELED